MTITRDAGSLQGQRVLSDGEAFTRAITEPEIEHVSATESGAFSWVSTFATGGTDIEVISIENENTTKDLIIDQFTVAASGAAVFTAGHVTGGTPAGTTLTPVCLNRDATKTALDTSFGNAAVTGSVTLSSMYSIPVATNTPFTVNTGGAILLGKDDAFGISCSTNVTVYVTVIGYYADPSEL